MTAAEKDELLIRLDERVGVIHRDICGNGKPGLKMRVGRIERIINIGLGIGMMVGLLVGLFTNWRGLLKTLLSLV